jgi:hypothetical protein
MRRWHSPQRSVNSACDRESGPLLKALCPPWACIVNSHPKATSGSAQDNQKRHCRSQCGRAKYIKSMRRARSLVVRMRCIFSKASFLVLQRQDRMHGSQQQHGIRQGNMHEQPTVEYQVEEPLAIELALFFADRFQIADGGMQRRR